MTQGKVVVKISPIAARFDMPGSAARTGGFVGSSEEPAALPVHTTVHILRLVQYEWDAEKEAKNYARHGVHFADAVGVFEDERALTEPDATTSEERFKTLGVDFLGRLLVVVYTYRDDTIRLIHARKATTRHRGIYERKRR